LEPGFVAGGKPVAADSEQRRSAPPRSPRDSLGVTVVDIYQAARTSAPLVTLLTVLRVSDTGWD